MGELVPGPHVRRRLIERQKLVDDLRATRDSLVEDAQQLEAIEREKARVPADDRRLRPLSDEAVARADELAAKARSEASLVDELEATAEG